MIHSLLSVIVPVYNTAPWLRKCLDSIINQTYRNLEIICVNDGSTDDSATILDEYAAKDARVKVIHQANAGVSVARNKGLDIAAGEYVSFVDSDDWLEPETYERVLIRMSDDVDMVWYGTAVEGDITADYRKVLEHHLLVGKSGAFRLDSGLRSYMAGEVWNKVFRRECVEKNALRFPQGLAYGEDKAFTYAYALTACKALFVAEPLYHYRLHGRSAMACYGKQKNRGAMARQVFDYVFRYAKEHGVGVKSSRSVLALLYDEYLIQALPAADAGMRRQLYAEGRQLGLLRDCCSPSAFALRHEFRRCWEKMFHGFVHNREYFGVGRLHFWSVTYDGFGRVHRILGFCVYPVSNK